MSRVVYKASCWDIGKTKRRLHDRKTKHFKSALLFIEFEGLRTELLARKLAWVWTTSHCLRMVG